MEIRAGTISYSIQKKKDSRKQEEVLANEINTLEQDITQHNLHVLEEKKEQLQAIRDDKLKGMIVRSRAQWLLEGEKASRYFCGLENRMNEHLF